MTIPLTTVLSYEHRAVMARYNKEYPGNRMKAKKAFPELLKYLWLCDKHTRDKRARPDDASLDFSCLMHSEMREIDDMWHTFILFTRDYQQFCEHHFGYFIHHEPLSSTQKSAFTKTFKKELTQYISYVYDHLGEQTVRRWFQV